MNKFSDEFIGCWYIYFHSKLKERSCNNMIKVDEAKNFLFQYRIPKNLRVIILKELESLGLIERDGTIIIIKNCPININNTSDLYFKAGLIPN